VNESTKTSRYQLHILCFFTEFVLQLCICSVSVLGTGKYLSVAVKSLELVNILFGFGRRPIFNCTRMGRKFTLQYWLPTTKFLSPVHTGDYRQSPNSATVAEIVWKGLYIYRRRIPWLFPLYVQAFSSRQQYYVMMLRFLLCKLFVYNKCFGGSLLCCNLVI